MNQGKSVIQKARRLIVILVMAGLLLLTLSPALMAAGIPPLPAIYSGQVVTNGGTPISAGILRAYIEGTLCSIPFQFTGGTFSSFPVGPKESAWSGKLVTFTVDVGGVEYPASSTPSIYWRSQEEIEGIVIITGAPAPVAVTGITLSPGNLNLIAGGGFSLLTATVLPADASNKAVTWSSSNPGVATVSNGLVTPLAPGNTIISVTTADGGYSASCAVTVISNQVPVTGIVLSASSLSLVQGGVSSTLIATVLPANASNKAVSWSSSNSGVASVSNGVVTPNLPGTAVITATTSDGGFTASCQVTVTAGVVPVSSVTISPSTLALTLGGGTGVLTATVLPANASNKAVSWSSSNPAVATVSNGVVTPVAVGSALIIVTTADGNKTANCGVTVLGPSTGPQLVVGSAVIREAAANDGSISDKQRLTGVNAMFDETITAADIIVNNLPAGLVPEVQIVPGNITQLDVSFRGKARNHAAANSVSNASITVKSAKLWGDPGDMTSNSFSILFYDPASVVVTGVTVAPTTLSFTLGGAPAALTATVSPANAANKTVTWQSSNPGAATVSDSGLVTPVGLGIATITATSVDGGFSASCLVTVAAAPVAASGVSLDRSSLQLAAGGAAPLLATVNPAEATNKAVTWQSSNPAVATVSNGLVTAVGAGSCTITVRTVDGGFSADCTVIVTVPVGSVSLSPNSLVLSKGQSQTLAATVLPANASNKAVTWQSSNPAVATVSEGLVTAVGGGSCTITVTTVEGNLSASCAVTVNVPVSSISLDRSTLGLALGESNALIATISPADASNQNLSWSSSNPGVAAVNSSGVVSAGSQTGTANITVITQDGGKSATCQVTVAAPVSGVSLSPGSLNLSLGQSQTLTATVSPADAGNKAVTWQSSDPAVATVSEGVVTAVGGGSCTITVTTQEGGKSAFCTVAVVVPVTSLTLNKSSLSLNPGRSETLIAFIQPANASNKNLVWSSSNPLVATVNNFGLVTAAGLGTCTITVSTQDGQKSASCTFNGVAVAVSSVTLNQSAITLPVGETAALVATVSPANATNPLVTWQSSNPAVATVSNGTINALGPGSSTITVTTQDGGKTATCTVMVTLAVSAVSLNPSSLDLKAGESAALIATIIPANASNQSLLWSSSNPAVATVSNGTVSAVGGGSCIITVTTVDGAKTATCAVTVTVPVTGVSLSKSSIILSLGGSQILTAVIQPANAGNKAVTWQSSNPLVATVDSSGRVAAVGNGGCIITVTTQDGGKTAECSVQVTVGVSGVSLDRTALQLEAGQSATLTATISPADAGNKTLAWGSSDPTVASVDNSGLVTAFSSGTCTITVTTISGGKVASCAVTVKVPISGISLNRTAIQLAVGTSETLVAAVSPANADNPALTWQSSDPAVAVVDANGRVTGSGAGSCTVAATAVEGGKNAVCTVTVIGFPDSVTLTADASHADCDSPVLLTASAGGFSNLLYEFWLRSPQDGSWQILRAYSAVNTLSFTRSVPGRCTLMVYAKAVDEIGGKVLVSEPMFVDFTKSGAVSGLTVSGPNGAQPVGSGAAFTALATDPGGNPRYQFWLHDETGWRVVQPYSAVNTYVLMNLTAGSYVIAVYALDQADINAGNWQAAYYQVFILNVGSSVSLTAPGSAKVGATVNLSASATAITGPEYQFWYQAPDGSWHQSGGYSPSGQFSFSATMAGSYKLLVFAKDHYAPATDQFAVTASKTVVVTNQD